MKTLMRWTIGGNVSKAGWECFSESIRIIPKIYPEFDYVICHNNMNDKMMNHLKSFGVDLYEQKHEEIGVPFEFNRKTTDNVSNHAWKLCPLRLRPNSHEIWIDNDIILWNRIPEIDEFLNNDKPIVSQTWSRELYGQFDCDVPDSCSICAGFFGLPPNFPFKEKIDNANKFKMPLSGFDEQGMIAYIITSNENGWIGIEPYHLNQLGWWDCVKEMPLGAHFIRLNTGTNSGWETYKILYHPSPKIINNKHWEYRDHHIKVKGTYQQKGLVSMI